MIPLWERPNETEDNKSTASSAHHSPTHVGNCFCLGPTPHVHRQLHTDCLQQDKVAEEGEVVVETSKYWTNRKSAVSRVWFWFLGQHLVCKTKFRWGSDKFINLPFTSSNFLSMMLKPLASTTDNLENSLRSFFGLVSGLTALSSSTSALKSVGCGRCIWEILRTSCFAVPELVSSCIKVQSLSLFSLLRICGISFLPDTRVFWELR